MQSKTILFQLITLLTFLVGGAHSEEQKETDVLVYGATPAGIAAALAAGEAGHEVALLEPTGRIGGMVTNGLSHTDFRTFEGITGTFAKFNRRVEQYYIEKYGEDSPQARGNFRGTHAEPKVNLAVFQAMLAEVPKIRVLTNHRLIEVATEEGGRTISSATFGSGAGGFTFKAKVFIDATYEGDLMAAAGVPWKAGREARSEFGESLAPEEADGQLQAYNFRLILTQDAENRVALTAPDGYDRSDFLPLVPLLEQGKLESVFCSNRGGIYKAQTPSLPNGKYDINDVSHGLVRLSLPGANLGWPDGTPEERQKIFDEHVRHNAGMLYFLQHDRAVPEKFQKEALGWGLCRDEFTDNGHLPEQLYVREARRMVGMHVFNENDTNYAEGDARAVFQKDSIAMGDYGENCHGTAHPGPRIGGKHTGEFYKRVPPYQIPYGVIVPQKCENLLVPVACSSTHVGFCALRLEPIWTSLGQAAGTAAAVMLEDGSTAQDADISDIQRRLHTDGAATMYISDVVQGHPDFAAVQWWGAVGGLHGLAPTPEEPGQRGEHIRGQYFKAYPGHFADLDAKLTDDLLAKWTLLAKEVGVTLEDQGSVRTRGDFVRSAYVNRPVKKR